jgi:hypothetical protein
VHHLVLLPICFHNQGSNRTEASSLRCGHPTSIAEARDIIERYLEQARDRASKSASIKDGLSKTCFTLSNFCGFSASALCIFVQSIQSISRPEFLRIMRCVAEEEIEEFRALFSAMDDDDSGFLDMWLS